MSFALKFSFKNQNHKKFYKEFTSLTCCLPWDEKVDGLLKRHKIVASTQGTARQLKLSNFIALNVMHLHILMLNQTQGFRTKIAKSFMKNIFMPLMKDVYYFLYPNVLAVSDAKGEDDEEFFNFLDELLYQSAMVNFNEKRFKQFLESYLLLISYRYGSYESGCTYFLSRRTSYIERLDFPEKDFLDISKAGKDLIKELSGVEELFQQTTQAYFNKRYVAFVLLVVVLAYLFDRPSIDVGGAGIIGAAIGVIGNASTSRSLTAAQEKYFLDLELANQYKLFGNTKNKLKLQKPGKAQELMKMGIELSITTLIHSRCLVEKISVLPEKEATAAVECTALSLDDNFPLAEQVAQLTRTQIKKNKGRTAPKTPANSKAIVAHEKTELKVDLPADVKGDVIYAGDLPVEFLRPPVKNFPSAYITMLGALRAEGRQRIELAADHGESGVRDWKGGPKNKPKRRELKLFRTGERAIVEECGEQKIIIQGHERMVTAYLPIRYFKK